MHIFSPTRLSLVLGTAALSSLCYAQEANLLIEEVKHGSIIERINPKYPMKAARSGQEGWVVVSFVIGKDGKVNSAIVEDSSNARMFNKATLRAVNKWVFEPTTVNGKAIEQCKNSVRMDFSLKNNEKGARHKFVSRYKNILSMMESKDYTSAGEAIVSLKKKGAWNLYEDAWLSSLEAKFFNKTGNIDSEMKALSHISSASQDYLNMDITLNHLIRLFNIYLGRNHFSDALSIAKKIKKKDTEQRVYPKFISTVSKIENFIASGDNYLVKGVIQDGVWHYDLARQSFSFQGDTDKLRKLDIRCDNKHLTYQVSQQSTWTIPNSYGQCSVYIYGDEHSSVELVEVSNQQT